VRTLRILKAVREAPRDAWNALVGDGSPFLEWEWLTTVEDSGSAVPAAGWLPQHLTLWEDGQLVGACPVYVKGHSLGEFVFDQGWAAAAGRAGIPYFPKLLVGVPFTPVTGARFLTVPGGRREIIDVLAEGLETRCRRERYSSVHANFCLPDETAVLGERGWLQRTAYQYHWSNPGFATFDDYLAGLRSKRRNQVRRERRAPAEDGVEIGVYTGAEIPAALLSRMFDLYRSTIERLPWGQQYLERRFFELAGERLRHRLCLVVARQGDEVIAGTFNVQKGDALYGRYWGATRALRHLHFNVCYYTAIEYCIRSKLRRFEPGAGGEFKQLRGFEPSATESMHFLVDRRLADAVREFLGRERRAIAAEMRWLEEQTALRRDRPEPDD
jgi:uncharacterized protein